MLSTDFTKAAITKCRALKSFTMGTGEGAEWSILWETADDAQLPYVAKKFGNGGRAQIITVEDDGTVRASRQHLGQLFPEYKFFKGIKAAIAWTEK